MKEPIFEVVKMEELEDRFKLTAFSRTLGFKAKIEIESPDKYISVGTRFTLQEESPDSP